MGKPLRIFNSAGNRSNASTYIADNRFNASRHSEQQLQNCNLAGNRLNSGLGDAACNRPNQTVLNSAYLWSGKFASKLSPIYSECISNMRYQYSRPAKLDIYQPNWIYVNH